MCVKLWRSPLNSSIADAAIFWELTKIPIDSWGSKLVGEAPKLPESAGSLRVDISFTKHLTLLTHFNIYCKQS